MELEDGPVGIWVETLEEDLVEDGLLELDENGVEEPPLGFEENEWLLLEEVNDESVALGLLLDLCGDVTEDATLRLKLVEAVVRNEIIPGPLLGEEVLELELGIGGRLPLGDSDVV